MHSPPPPAGFGLNAKIYSKLHKIKTKKCKAKKSEECKNIVIKHTAKPTPIPGHSEWKWVPQSYYKSKHEGQDALVRGRRLQLVETGQNQNNDHRDKEFKIFLAN